MTPPILAILTALALTFALTPVVRRLAIRFDVIDHPGGRRVHERPTPRWGGLAIYFGFMGAVVVVVAITSSIRFDSQLFGILIGGTVVAIVGLLDDKFELPAAVQAIAIIAAATVLALAGVRIRYITNPFPPHPSLVWLQMWSIPVTVIWVFGVTKTMDLMDGIDGLAAGIGAIAAGTLLIMALQAKSAQPDLARSFLTVGILAGALLGASLGFLRFNFPPANIFMGTIGAQFIGFILASASIMGAFKLAALFAVAVPLLALAVPIMDTAFVMLRRFIDRRPLHEADKTHVHHRLLDRGFSHRQTLLVIYGLTALLSAIGLLLFTWIK